MDSISKVKAYIKSGDSASMMLIIEANYFSLPTARALIEFAHIQDKRSESSDKRSEPAGKRSESPDKISCAKQLVEHFRSLKYPV